MTSELTIELAPSESPRPAAERARLLEDSRVRSGVHRPHGDGALFPRQRLAQRATRAYAPLVLDPATSALHYGQSIFEGLKAYHQPDGGAALFRPDQNAARFQRSARRMAMAELPTGLFLDAVHELVRADRDWVPTAAR